MGKISNEPNHRYQRRPVTPAACPACPEFNVVQGSLRANRRFARQSTFHFDIPCSTFDILFVIPSGLSAEASAKAEARQSTFHFDIPCSTFDILLRPSSITPLPSSVFYPDILFS